MSSGLKKIIGVVIGIAIVGIGYYYLNGNTETTEDGLSVATSEDLQNQIGKDLLTTLETIRGIKLDKSIVQGALFMSLQDFSVPISPQPVGRDNPFAPTGL